jgi:hypothetical protein
VMLTVLFATRTVAEYLRCQGLAGAYLACRARLARDQRLDSGPLQFDDGPPAHRVVPPGGGRGVCSIARRRQRCWR